MTEKKQPICPMMSLLTLMSKRHMLLIVYTLRNDALGFNELQEKIGVNSATLSTRLRDLVNAKLLEKHTCTQDARQQYYSLTARGKKLHKALLLFSKI